MTQLRKTMLEELQRRNLSKLTADCYVRVVEEFSLFYHRPPDQLGPEQIREYQAHLFADRKLDANTVAQHLSALRFFYNKTLRRNLSVEETPFPKRPIRLPDILSREEVERLINSAANRLHRIWLLTLYATGVRREELVQLKVSDIDSARMMVEKQEIAWEEHVLSTFPTLMAANQPELKNWRGARLLRATEGSRSAPGI